MGLRFYIEDIPFGPPPLPPADPTAPPPSSPLILTLDATNVETGTPQLNGEILWIGLFSVVERGFVFGTTSHDKPGNVHPNDSGYDNFTLEEGEFGVGSFNTVIGGIEAQQTYYVRAWVKYNDTYLYANEKEFEIPQLIIPISGHCVNGNMATVVHGTTIPAYGWVEYWQKDSPEEVLTSKPSTKILAETEEQWELGELLNVEYINALRLTKDKEGALVQKIEVFTESGTFNVPAFVDKVDVLVVAGGGGGAHTTGEFGRGGGGAGGCILLENYAVDPESLIDIVVGNGGDGGSDGGAGSKGQNSSFDSITAQGGGFGGTFNGDGGSGGSGGGAGPSGGNGQSGGSGILGQGQDGGDTGTGPGGGAGGGGANQKGQSIDADVYDGGSGGNGMDVSHIFGTAYGENGVFAGGGGATPQSYEDRSDVYGQGGMGGGGNAGVPGENGLANSGGGGGATNESSSPAGNGGSGVVIVRYVGTLEDIPDGEPTLVYQDEGNRVYTHNFVQPRVLWDDLIEVELEKDEPAGTSVVAEMSLDGGETWIEVEDGQAYGEFGQELQSIMTRVTLSTENNEVTPAISKFNLNYGYFTEDSLTKFHSALLLNLSPGTTYEYHVYAVSQDGQEYDKFGCKFTTEEDIIFIPWIFRPVLTVEKVDTVNEIQVAAGLVNVSAQKLDQDVVQLNMPGYIKTTEIASAVNEIEKSHKLILSTHTEVT